MAGMRDVVDYLFKSSGSDNKIPSRCVVRCGGNGPLPGRGEVSAGCVVARALFPVLTPGLRSVDLTNSHPVATEIVIVQLIPSIRQQTSAADERI